MAAGLGFKDFTTGEVLTAADVDGYLMQGIWVFASAAARDAAVTSPQEGNFAFLKDTNVTTYYTGSAWTNLDTTGMVNPMTTTGDTIYSSSGSTPARLGIGSTGDVLTVSGGLPVWSAPASGGGMTLIETLALTSGSSVTSSTIAGTYTDLQIIIRDSYSNNGSAYSMRLNGDTGNNYFHYYIRNDNGSISGPSPTTGSDIALNGATATTTGYKNVFYSEIHIPRYSGSNYKSIFHTSYMGAYPGFYLRYALWDNTAAITSVTIKCDGGNFAAGNAYIYGVK